MTTGYLGTWSTGVGQLMAFDTTDWVSRPGTVGAGPLNRVDVTSDGENISYYTPRFAGFQFGVSYIPSTDEDVNNQRALSGGNADFEGWSLGVNFNRKFGDVGVGIAAGYNTMKESTANAGADPEVWGVGARFDFAGFRLGVSWVDRKSQDTAALAFNSAATISGQETLELGARYMFGPNAVSIGYATSESDSVQAARNGDESDTVFLAYRRTLGPGVSWKVTAIFADFDDGLAGAPAGNSNSGKALTTSIAIRF